MIAQVLITICAFISGIGFGVLGYMAIYPPSQNCGRFYIEALDERTAHELAIQLSDDESSE